MDKINIEELEQLGLTALKDFWGLQNGVVATLTKDQVSILIKKASFGMQLYKELGVGRRANEQNTFRFCNLIAKDKDELKKLLKASLPQYYITPKK